MDIIRSPPTLDLTITEPLTLDLVVIDHKELVGRTKCRSWGELWVNTRSSILMIKGGKCLLLSLRTPNLVPVCRSHRLDPRVGPVDRGFRLEDEGERSRKIPVCRVPGGTEPKYGSGPVKEEVTRASQRPSPSVGVRTSGPEEEG